MNSRTVLSGRASRYSLASAVLLIAFLVGMVGCGSGGATTSLNADPSIEIQPSDASAQVGQTATFTVVARGSGTLDYQWYRNGASISSANSTSYTTGTLSSSDFGAQFSVVVSNNVGQTSSNSARLNLGPRSPLPGDLRFQQVAADTTAPGYTTLSHGTITYPSTMGQANGWGTPLSVGPGCAGASSSAGCKWTWLTFARPGLTGISGGYTNQPASDLDFFMTSEPDGVVVNGLAIDRALDNAGFSQVARSGSSGFTYSKQTVSLGELAAALAASGMAGAVPTAISPDNGNITFVAYTWKSNTAAYDVELRQTTASTVLVAATELAQSGYIITASGGAGDDVFLVGTRVHGDTVPRPILTLQAGQSLQVMNDGGYSIVAIGADSSGNVLWCVGEK